MEAGMPPTEKGYRIDDATGRGLHLLDCLAAAWGWKRTGIGKVVWFDLPVPLDGDRHLVRSASRTTIPIRTGHRLPCSTRRYRR